MSIYKKSSGVWWVDFRSPSGTRIRHSTRTTEKKLAQEYHDKLKHEYWNVSYLDRRPERTIEEALLRFLEVSEGQKDMETKINHAEYWGEILAGRSLSSLTTDDILNGLPVYKKGSRERLAPSTQNRYRTSIMRVLSLARQANWIDSVPYVPKNKEAPVRVRWITTEEAQLLINNLNLKWMKSVCSFALLTGARMSEILSMTWAKVDFQRQIAIVTNDVAKSGKARPLPLNTQAIELLIHLKSEAINQYVFHRNSQRQIDRISWTDFNRSLERSGITDFRFHDLRHTWASWHVQNGTPLYVLKEMGGWETLEMVKKYAHLNADHMLKYANMGTFSPPKAVENTKLINETVISN